MAYRCIACPYDWNVPKNYDELPQEQKDLYFHAWTIDGNFKADHTTSRRPGNNVQIFPGSGFLPDLTEFAESTKSPKTDKNLPKDVVGASHGQGQSLRSYSFLHLLRQHDGISLRNSITRNCQP